MRILITTKIVYDKLNRTFNHIIDNKIFDFLEFTFPKSKITLINSNNIYDDYDLLFIVGGSNLLKFSKALYVNFRYKQDTNAINIFLTKNKPIVGVCYGAQLIANKYNSEIQPIRGHTANFHNIKLKNEISKVNSFHDYGIIRLGNKLEELHRASDGSYEAFHSSDYRLLGIMWHPERYKKFKISDKKIINKYINY